MYQLNGKTYVTEKGAWIVEGHRAAVEAGLGEGYWTHLYSSLYRAQTPEELKQARSYIEDLRLNDAGSPIIEAKLKTLKRFYQRRRRELNGEVLPDSAEQKADFSGSLLSLTPSAQHY